MVDATTGTFSLWLAPPTRGRVGHPERSFELEAMPGREVIHVSIFRTSYQFVRE